MGFLVGQQTTATAIGASLTTLLNWTAVDGYSSFHLMTENTGGGTGTTITDVQLDQSDDAGVTVSLDAIDVSPAAAIVTGLSDHVTFTPTASYIRIRAVSGTDTTAKCWVTADNLSNTIDTYALTSLENVKSYLGITSTDNDSEITRLINAVTYRIETYCSRRFKTRSYTLERYTCKDIYVDNWPIISVERVAVGTKNSLTITNTDSGAYSATCSITRSADPLPANTHIKLSVNGGSNGGDTSIAFADYATLTLLAAQINDQDNWTATVVADMGIWASDELIQIGSSECLNQEIGLEVPDRREDDYLLDEQSGLISLNSYQQYYYPHHGSYDLDIGYTGGHKHRSIVYVDYTGGFATIPADLEQIAIEIVGTVFKKRKLNENVKSEKIGDYEYTLGGGVDVNSAVIARAAELNLWRRLSYA